jgi:16S rRNA (guanine527-N7)-methyltransferase
VDTGDQLLSVDEAVRDALFERYPAARSNLEEFVSVLATDGLTRGLIGPREVDRLWSRHVANSAVVEELVPEGSSMVDVGSGAGLPGIPIALVRPDISMILVEPLLRRSTFLSEVVERLQLADRVTVLRGRAEEVSLQVDVVTARAVAPLDRLAGWTLPLAKLGGTVLALKGENADTELQDASDELERMGGGGAQVLTVGAAIVNPPTTVIRIMKLKAPRRAGRR